MWRADKRRLGTWYCTDGRLCTNNKLAYNNLMRSIYDLFRERLRRCLSLQRNAHKKAKHGDYTHERGRSNNLDKPQLTVRKTLSKSISLEPCVQESIWLWASRHGVNANEMATRDGVSTRRIQFGLAAAACRESRMLKDVRHPPRLVPLFPLGPYSPQSACRRHRPIERGSVFCCMVCHTSGQDDHPALQLDPRFDPKLDDTSTYISQKHLVTKGSVRRRVDNVVGGFLGRVIARYRDAPIEGANRRSGDDKFGDSWRCFSAEMCDLSPME